MNPSTPVPPGKAQGRDFCMYIHGRCRFCYSATDRSIERKGEIGELREDLAVGQGVRLSYQQNGISGMYLGADAALHVTRIAHGMDLVGTVGANRVHYIIDNDLMEFSDYRDSLSLRQTDAAGGEFADPSGAFRVTLSGPFLQLMRLRPEVLLLVGSEVLETYHGWQTSPYPGSP